MVDIKNEYSYSGSLMAAGIPTVYSYQVQACSIPERDVWV